MRKSVKQRLKSAFFGVLLAVAPIACKEATGFEDYENVGSNVPQIEYPTNVNEKYRILRWVADNIEYKSDFEQYGVSEYWASINEIWDRKADDCEGLVAMDMFLHRRDKGIDSRFIGGRNRETGKWHAWFEMDGELYDAQHGVEVVYVSPPIEDYDIRERYSYDQVLEKIAKYHRVLGTSEITDASGIIYE